MGSKSYMCSGRTCPVRSRSRKGTIGSSKERAGNTSGHKSICVSILRSWRHSGTCKANCQYWNGHLLLSGVSTLPLSLQGCVCRFVVRLLFWYAKIRLPIIPYCTALQATQGESWVTAFKRWDVYVDPCYKLYPDIVSKITMETVLAPTMEV